MNKTEYIKKITKDKKTVNCGTIGHPLRCYEVDYSLMNKLMELGGVITQQPDTDAVISAYSEADYNCKLRALSHPTRKWADAIIELDGVCFAACDDGLSTKPLSGCCNAQIFDGYCEVCGLADDGRHN